MEQTDEALCEGLRLGASLHTEERSEDMPHAPQCWVGTEPGTVLSVAEGSWCGVRLEAGADTQCLSVVAQTGGLAEAAQVGSTCILLTPTFC